MLKNRKTTKTNLPSKLKKSNALKLKQTTAITKKSLKGYSSTSLLQENTFLRNESITKEGFNLHFASQSEAIYSPFKK